MATQGLSKHLPKRASKEHRSHITRQRSRNAREAQRLINIKENDARHAANLKRGFTGKQLDNAARRFAKERGLDYRKELMPFLVHETTQLTVASEMGLI